MEFSGLLLILAYLAAVRAQGAVQVGAVASITHAAGGGLVARAEGTTDCMCACMIVRYAVTDADTQRPLHVHIQLLSPCSRPITQALGRVCQQVAPIPALQLLETVYRLPRHPRRQRLSAFQRPLFRCLAHGQFTRHPGPQTSHYRHRQHRPQAHL